MVNGTLHGEQDLMSMGFHWITACIQIYIQMVQKNFMNFLTLHFNNVLNKILIHFHQEKLFTIIWQKDLKFTIANSGLDLIQLLKM